MSEITGLFVRGPRAGQAGTGQQASASSTTSVSRSERKSGRQQFGFAQDFSHITRPYSEGVSSL